MSWIVLIAFLACGAALWGFNGFIGAVMLAAAVLNAPWWRALAWIVSRRPVARWLIARSRRTPYTPITSRDGSEIYMARHWLFNGYAKDSDDVEAARWPWLPSIRVHHILRADDDGHMHSHPWDARTIVLDGWYREERPAVDGMRISEDVEFRRAVDGLRIVRTRSRGYTGPVTYEMVHRISEVSPGGVYTLWFTWKYQGTWGFLVDGKIVPWREYLGVPKK